MLAVEVAEARGVRIDWGMVWVAWAGITPCPLLMSTDEILALARERLTDCSDAELPAVLAIADGGGSDRLLIQTKLHELFVVEGGCEEIAVRKWRLLLLQNLLDSLTPLPKNRYQARDAVLNTVLEIADFWGDYQHLDDAPLSMRRGNRTTLHCTAYLENMEGFLQEQREWAEHEGERLYPRSASAAGSA